MTFDHHNPHTAVPSITVLIHSNTQPLHLSYFLLYYIITRGCNLLIFLYASTTRGQKNLAFGAALMISCLPLAVIVKPSFSSRRRSPHRYLYSQLAVRQKKTCFLAGVACERLIIQKNGEKKIEKNPTEVGNPFTDSDVNKNNNSCQT